MCEELVQKVRKKCEGFACNRLLMSPLKTKMKDIFVPKVIERRVGCLNLFKISFPYFKWKTENEVLRFRVLPTIVILAENSH